MTEEEKQLLLKDLCARLPYGVKISPKEKDTGEYDKKSGSNYMYPDVIDIEVFIPDGDNTRIEYGDWIIYLDNIQMYLRPMSSMTEEEKNILQALHNVISNENYGDGYSPSAWKAITEWEDYCNEHHLDYRGLIPLGLALEAPNEMYETE